MRIIRPLFRLFGLPNNLNRELIDLAAQFFVQDDRLNDIDADLERKTQNLREQAE